MKNIRGQQFDARHKLFGMQRELAGVGVANRIGQEDHQYCTTIGCAPGERALVSLRADATPEDSTIYAAASQDLGHLSDMAKAIRHIAHTHGRAKFGGTAQADL